MSTKLFGKRELKNERAAARLWVKILCYKRDNGKCFWCGREVTLKTDVWPIPFNLATVDHIIPASKGGKSHSSNMVLSCMPCNADRADMPADEYLEIVKRRSVQS